MKIFGMETTLKYMTLQIDDKEYTIFFNYSFWKGIYDVTLIEVNETKYGREGKQKECILNYLYPKLSIRVKKLIMEYIPMWLKKRYRKLKRMLNKLERKN